MYSGTNKNKDCTCKQKEIEKDDEAIDDSDEENLNKDKSNGDTLDGDKLDGDKLGDEGKEKPIRKIRRKQLEVCILCIKMF